jgi:plastocyanin
MILRHRCGRGPWLRLGTIVALGALLLAPAGAAQPGRPDAGRADTGRIVGRVRLGLRPSPRPLSTNAYSRQVTTPGTPASELGNVLVWIKDRPRSAALPPVEAELRQRDEQFVPHIVAIPAGSSVSFPNDDLLFHNVFSLSRAATFDLGRYPQGGTRVRKFDKPGVVKVYCHLHSHMSAIVAVFDHPWFAKVGEDGAFAIERVPAGRHVLTGWHERAGNTDQSVTVEAGDTARVELVVPIAAP